MISNKRKKRIHRFISIMLFFMMLFYQWVLPFSISVAYAESDTSSEESEKDEDKEEDEKKEKKKKDKDEKDEKDEKKKKDKKDKDDDEDEDKDEDDKKNDDKDDDSKKGDKKDDKKGDGKNESNNDNSDTTKETDKDSTTNENSDETEEKTEGQENAPPNFEDPNNNTGGNDTDTVTTENEADADNDVDVSSDSGNNSIGQKDPCKDSELDDDTNQDQEKEHSDCDNNQKEEDSESTNSVESTDGESESKDEESNEDNTDEENTDNSTHNNEDYNEDESIIDAIINTGEALAQSDVVNTLNTTVIGDNWQEFLMNITGLYEGDINLLELFSNILAQSMGEEEETDGDSYKKSYGKSYRGKDKCKGDYCRGETEINNSNTANVTNDIVVDANSGNNSIDNVDGDATINTGDALGVANVSNMVNTTMIGDNWLFGMINVFGHWVGDLIIPGQEVLLEADADGNLRPKKIETTNDATITNNVDVNAATGENSIEDAGGDATIKTGDATAIAEVKTDANNTYVGDNWFSLAINMMGQWTGLVLNWDKDSNQLDPVFAYNLDDNGSDCPRCGVPVSILNANNATITNNVTVNANSGTNTINGAYGDSSITTGDATALANVYNFANNTFIGDNWMFGVVNVFGTWEGNVEFAYPDLAVLITDNKDGAIPGERYAYTISTKNFGKAPAKNTRVGISIPDETAPHGASEEIYGDGSDLEWLPGDVGPDEERSIVIFVEADEDAKTPKDLIAKATVSTETNEKNTENNSSKDATELFFPSLFAELEDDLEISRSDVTPSELFPGEIVHHELIIANNGNAPILDIMVTDTLTDPLGRPISTIEWPLGGLFPEEELLIEYDVQINPYARTGTYSNNATAEGMNVEDDDVKTATASTSMYVRDLAYLPVLEGEKRVIPVAQAAPSAPTHGDPVVLGATTCSPLPVSMLVTAGAAYILAIHWSFFRNGGALEGSARAYSRRFGMPLVATLTIGAFWYIYFCGTYGWLLATILAFGLGIVATAFLHYKKKFEMAAESELVKQ